jgi:hypothetical protein
MHRTIQGYLDMGRPAVPPLPNFFVLTARDNGVQYVLTFTGTAPALTFASEHDPAHDPGRDLLRRLRRPLRRERDPALVRHGRSPG